MFKYCGNTGDSLDVPQLVFSKLSNADVGESRFRVALYLIAEKTADAAQVAKALHLPVTEAERALAYWEGAGLLAQDCADHHAPSPTIKAKPRTTLNTTEVNKMAQTDPALGVLVQETQQQLGITINRNDTCRLVTLYKQDDFPVDLIMMAAHQCAQEKNNTVYSVERKLFAWRKEGVTTCEDADNYLLQLASREEKEAELATLFGHKTPSFTVAERRRIARWYEEFDYSLDMIEAARTAAGKEQNNVLYLHKILERWHNEGHQTPRDVTRTEAGKNIRVQRSGGNRTDVLENARYVPMSQKREQP